MSNGDDDDMTTTRHHHNDSGVIGTPVTGTRYDFSVILAHVNRAGLSTSSQTDLLDALIAYAS